MPNIQCPNCQATLKYDPARAGHAAVCPQCHGRFRIPKPKHKEPLGFLSTPKQSSESQFPLAGMHWAKKLMLVATLLWPTTCLGCGCMVSARSSSIERQAGNGLVYNTQTGSVTEKGTAQATTGAAIVLTWIMVTMVYLFVMLVLLIVWFITSP